MNQDPNTTTNTSLDKKDRELLSFSGIFFFWFTFTSFWSFIILFIYLISSIMFGFLELDLFLIILGILLLLWSQIYPLTMTMSALPFKPIDFSRRALLISFLHKLFYLCTSPILIIGVIGSYYISLTYFVRDMDWAIIITGILFSGTIWIFLSMWFWDTFITESQTMKVQRYNKKYNSNEFDPYLRTEQSIKVILGQTKTIPNISDRYMLSIIGLIILLFMVIAVFAPFNRYFIFVFLVVISIVLLSMPMGDSGLYKEFLDRHSIDLSFLSNISEKLFGKQDISKRAFRNTILLMSLIAVFHYFSFIMILPMVRKADFFAIFIYLLLSLIFILAGLVVFIHGIWNNQITPIFKRITKEKDDSIDN